MASVDPILSPIKTSLPNESENPTELDSFCQNYFHMTADVAKHEWDYDADALVSQAVHIKGEIRSTIFEAVRHFFPFKAKAELPFGTFPPPLLEFPLFSLLHPCEKFNVGKWKESQLVFRKIALAFIDFRRLSPEITAEKFVDTLIKQSFFASTGLDAKYKETFYNLLRSFFNMAMTVSLEPLDFKLLQSSPGYRIYTLNNVMLAIKEPQKILDALCTAQAPLHKDIHQADIINYAETFFHVSIKLHLQYLLLREGELTKTLPLGSLKALCIHSTPFLHYALAAMQKKTADLHLTDPLDYLSNPLVGSDHQTSPVACTLLQALLKTFGFEAALYMRKDIPPIKTGCLIHALIVVIHPLTGKKIIVDPTYQQFLEKPSREIKQAIFVCPEEELETAMQNHAAQDRYKLLKKVWDLAAYSPVRLNLVAEQILSTNTAVKEPEYLAVRQIVKKVGLEKELSCPSLQERQKELIQVGKSLEKTALIEALGSLPNEAQEAFIQPLGLDPRPIQFLLMQVRAVGYAMALKQAINPDNRSDTTTLYGCAGSDLSTALLATNSRMLFMLEKTPINEKTMRAVLKTKINPKAHAHFLAMKSIVGGGESEAHGMDSIEIKIALELLALGVDLMQVTVTSSSSYNGFTLSFPWNYHGQAKATYHATWICAHLDNPDSYPQGLKDLLAKQNIDFYYQKAAVEAPRNYSKFLPAIARGLKTGGYLLMSHYDNKRVRHDPEPFLQLPDAEFQPEANSALMQAYQTLSSGLLYQADFIGHAANVPTQEEYWMWTPMVKKIPKSVQK